MVSQCCVLCTLVRPACSRSVQFGLQTGTVVQETTPVNLRLLQDQADYSPRESVGVCFTGVGLCVVCLSVCDHDNYKDCGRICTKFYRKVPRGKVKIRFVFRYDRQRHVKVTVKKLRKPAIVYIFRIAACSSLIVCVASVAKCWRQKPQISLS